MCTFAAGKRIPVEARRTLALVTARQILAHGVRPAGRFVPEFRAFVGVPAFTGLRVPQIAALTDANAFAHELVQDTHLGSRTRRFGGTLTRALSLGTPVSVRVSVRPAGTLTRKRSRSVVAHRSGPAWVALTLVNVRTSGIGIPGVPGRTLALGVVLEQHAFRIGTALHVFARI